MAEKVKQYENIIRTAGLQITEARPVDDRLDVLSETVVVEAFTAPFTAKENDFRAVLYDNLVIKSKASGMSYIWTESDFGLLSAPYTYPVYDPDYSGKSYNFVIYDKVVKIDMIYSNTGVSGFQIANSLLPYSVLFDKSSAQVYFKSSASSYTEMEFPDKIEINNDGILIVLDPAPTVSEQFNITIL